MMPLAQAPRDLGAAEGGVLPLRQPRRPSDVTAYVGMMVFLGGWTMMFGALFFSYAIVRVRAGSWPPEGEAALPILLPAFNTALLIGASGALQLALSAVRTARPRALVRYTLFSIALGAAFFALQCVMWRRMYLGGLRPDTGMYGSVFYALTTFHALHVVVGLIGLLTLLPRLLRGRFSIQHHTPVRMWTLYWHFVDAVWVLMFISIYVL